LRRGKLVVPLLLQKRGEISTTRGGGKNRDRAELPSTEKRELSDAVKEEKKKARVKSMGKKRFKKSETLPFPDSREAPRDSQEKKKSKSFPGIIRGNGRLQLAMRTDSKIPISP